MAPREAELSAARRWSLALVATATMAVSYVDRQTFAVLAPTVTKELGLTGGEYGTLVASFSVTYMIFPPLAGRLLDRVGVRLGLLAAVLTWSAVAGGHALAVGFSSLLALRLLLGAAEAPSFPGAAATVARALPVADRGAGFGLLFTGSSIGAMIAPPLATWLAHHWGWRARSRAAARSWRRWSCR